jgi:hypothetical protein
MKLERGNLWDHWERGSKVVVTTNIGWDPATKRNNMGAGVALQAARRWPWLPEWYGRFCRATFPYTPVIEHDQLRLIFLPVKPLLSRANPEISWNQSASLYLIGHSVQQLRFHEGEIALAFPGCGNGGLDMVAVGDVLHAWLLDDRFTVVDQAWGVGKPERTFLANGNDSEHWA